MKPPNGTSPPPAPPDQVSTASNISQSQSPAAQHQQSQQSKLANPSTNTMPPTTAAIQQQSQQQSTLNSLKDTNNVTTVNVASQPIITTQAIVVLKSANIAPSHEQQAPLALTTQTQNKTPNQASTLQLQQALPTVVSTNTVSLQPHQLTPPHNLKDSNNIGRSNMTPQALITTQANIITKTSTISAQNEQQTPLALITQPQNKPSNQATSSPTPQVQQQIPMPVAASTTNVKQEPNKFVCCLLDQGVRCERVAGNASFSARIQKIVASKKMNFALDPVVRHTYICDHHKAVITVAKKSVPTARETKAAARNLAVAAAAAAANNVSTNVAPQHMNNYNELAMNQTAIQHPVNLEFMTNQGRLANNHTGGMIIGMPIRPGAQIAYGHYNHAPHPNQLGRMDHTIMTSSNFDNTGGDNIPSGSGGIDVDLQQLQVNTLRRYKRHFRVPTRPGLNKMQLAESLKHHFRTLPIIEKEAITYFVYIVKSSRNKLDHNPKAD